MTGKSGQIWSFPDFSDTAKQAMCLRDQWRKFKFLFFHRAMGSYSLTEFDRFLSPRAKGWAWILAYFAAAFPGNAANLIVVIYYFLFKRSSHLALFDVLCSRFATATSRSFARALGLTVTARK